jgi:hypothetical protein
MNTTAPQTGTAIPPAAANGPKFSPAEFVRLLSPEDKQAVFLTLLREALELNGDSGLLPIEDEDGKPLGHYVPTRAARASADRMWNDLPVGVREALGRPVSNPDDYIPADRLLAILSRADGSRPK